MKLIITEKPSVARDIARVLKATTKKEGFIEGNGMKITWALGHLIDRTKYHNKISNTSNIKTVAPILINVSFEQIVGTQSLIIVKKPYIMDMVITTDSIVFVIIVFLP